MHYILFLSLQGLYVGARDRGSKPVAIHRDKTLIDADPLARKLGAHPGLPLREAKSMLSGVTFVEWDSDMDAEVRSSWLDGMMEFTDRIESTVPHEAFLDLTGHPDPLSIVPACLEKAKLPLTAGLGSAKWIARAAVHANQPLSQDNVVRPELSLRDLPASVLPIPRETVDRLAFLGYRTIGSVQKAPREVLDKQFDELGMVIFSSARGGQVDLVDANYPPDTIAVRVFMESPWEDVEHRDAELRTLASRMGRALVDRDRAARCLQLILVDEKGTQEHRERTFSKPLRTGIQVFSALRGLAEEVFPAIEARARLSKLEKAPARQLELARVARGGRSDTIQDAVEGVRSKFGSTSLMAGSEVRMPRRKVVLRAWCDATGWV